MGYDRTASDLNRQAAAARDLLAELADDDADLNHDMAEGETSLFEAIDAALAEIDDCDVIVSGCKEKEAQLAGRRQRAAARQERLRTLIEQAMLVAGLETVKRPCATFSVAQVKPKPLVTDEALIPAAFWKQPDPVLDKAKLNEAAKSGESVPGVTLSNGGTTLKIRRA